MRKHTTRTLNSWVDTDSAAHAPTHACMQRADPTQNAKTNYMHIRISHGPRQGACKRSCDTYLHRDIDSEDRNTRIHTTNFSTEVHIIHDTGNITAKMQTAACRLASL